MMIYKDIGIRVRVGRNAVAVDSNENMVRYMMTKRKEEKDAPNAVCAEQNYFREYRTKIPGSWMISNAKAHGI